MTARELQEALQKAEEAAVLVSPQVLERIIRQSLRLPAWKWTVPHFHSFIVDRQSLFRFVEQEDLLLRSDHLLPATVLLFPTPDGTESAEETQALLLEYWRRLFHASIERVLNEQTSLGHWTPPGIEKDIDALGPTAFEEIRTVLIQEDRLPPEPDNRAVYLEFVAVFWELHYFARHLLPSFFPALDLERARALLSRNLDVKELFRRTRLEGAPDPRSDPVRGKHEVHEYFHELVAESDRAIESGNIVRGAIQRRRAARVAPAAQAYDTRQEALDLLHKLLSRLQSALALQATELPEWSTHLQELLDKADQGTWPSEAALLYDLQKACHDHERDIYTLDLVEWMLSGGRKPIKRPLASQRFVRITRHVRSAVQRLPRVRLSDADRRHLGDLLQTALHRCEERVRKGFRPILESAFEDVGLTPRNPPEQTAFAKMVEQLLDRILEYGFLTFSDLRDTLSRNLLKLPDLSDPQDFIRGDPLLRLDRRLSTLLDGVYRRGEFYLRWLERFTALNFGTVLGRLLTRFVTLPFAAAFLVVYGFHHFLLHPLGVEEFPLYVFLPVWILTGGFFLALLHSETVREKFVVLARRAWRPLRITLVDGPLWLIRNAEWKRLISTWSFQLFYWYFFKPLLLCAVLWLLVPQTFATWVEITLTFLAANFLINSRPGQSAGEAINHALLQFLAQLRGGLIPGLIRLIVEVSKKCLHYLEAGLFTVDEWLRFRGGESRLALVVRIVLGVIWFPISYFARFNLVVLIEPGLNPLKFPICSIAAKILYPLTPIIKPWLEGIFTPVLGETLTWGLVVWLIFWMPDVFGFLIWEMKENWSLYRANRGEQLKPVAIGSHGETMRRLLQPGFHSGTIPKLFRRLRQTEQKALRSGNFAKVRAAQAALEEVRKAVRLFVERDFIKLIEEEDEVWKGKLRVAQVTLATNRAHVSLVHCDHPDEPFRIEFEVHAGWLMAGLGVGAPPPQPLLDESGSSQDVIGTHDQSGAIMVLDPSKHGILENGAARQDAAVNGAVSVNGADSHTAPATPEAARHAADTQFSEKPLPPERNGEAPKAPVERVTWIHELSPELRRTLHNALAIFYKLAGVDIVREQVQACFPGENPRFTPDALLLPRGDAPPLVYRLRPAGELLEPRGDDPASEGAEPRTIPAGSLLFCRVPVTWRELSYCWFPHSSHGLLAASVPLVPTRPEKDTAAAPSENIRLLTDA